MKTVTALAYLSTLTLDEFCSEMELIMHDWLHMRWATVICDPSNSMPLFGIKKRSCCLG